LTKAGVTNNQQVAALITGRNHHSVGSGVIGELSGILSPGGK
jgi:hypothetical protein